MDNKKLKDKLDRLYELKDIKEFLDLACFETISIRMKKEHISFLSGHSMFTKRHMTVDRKTIDRVVDELISNQEKEINALVKESLIENSVKQGNKNE